MVGVWVLITISMLCCFDWLVKNMGSQATLVLVIILAVAMIIERTSHRYFQLKKLQTKQTLPQDADDDII